MAFKIDPCPDLTNAERMTGKWDRDSALEIATRKAETLLGVRAKAKLLKFMAEEGEDELNEAAAVKFAASVAGDVVDLIAHLPNDASAPPVTGEP